MSYRGFRWAHTASSLSHLSAQWTSVMYPVDEGDGPTHWPLPSHRDYQHHHESWSSVRTHTHIHIDVHTEYKQITLLYVTNINNKYMIHQNNTFLAGGKEVSSAIVTDFASSKFCSLFLAASSWIIHKSMNKHDVLLKTLDSPVIFDFYLACVVQLQTASSSFSFGSVMPPSIAMATDIGM